MVDHLTLRVAAFGTSSSAGGGVVGMDRVSRDALGVEPGDAVEISGGGRPAVANVCGCVPADEGLGRIYMDVLTRSEACAEAGDEVRVRRIVPREAERVVIAPDRTADRPGEPVDGLATLIGPNIGGRVLKAGMRFAIPGLALRGVPAEFFVTRTEPEGPVTVCADTRLDLAPELVAWTETVRGIPITDADIGGLEDELGRLRDAVASSLGRSEVFRRMGVVAPRGVLVCGPAGIGKTMMVEAVVNGLGISALRLNGSLIRSGEVQLADMFKKAREKAPCLILIEDLDRLAPDGSGPVPDREDGSAGSLSGLMDGMRTGEGIVVVGTARDGDSVDPALRRSGRFDRRIDLDTPDRDARRRMLDVCTRDMPLEAGVDLGRLSEETTGFTGADLAALCREAAVRCVGTRALRPTGGGHADADARREVRMEDFGSALAAIRPSVTVGVSAGIPGVTWDDIGGLESIRRDLTDAFVPEEGAPPYRRLGITPYRGVLLYGPPGTGKTLIAKALANTAGASFISVSGPEIASKWLGESERAVRDIFERARRSRPCIIFFDEVESIAPRRGRDANAVWDHVVAQLLTSIDGMRDRGSVSVIAATNRPDMVDPALLRPGRMDRLILVGRPDEAARRRILEIHTRGMPLEDVDLDALAKSTEGYVGADLAALCREAGLEAYREDADAEAVRMEHFMDALEHSGPSVDDATYSFYENIGTSIRKPGGRWEDLPSYR